MSTASTQYSFSVASVKKILDMQPRIKQRELSLTPNIFQFFFENPLFCYFCIKINNSSLGHSHTLTETEFFWFLFFG